MVTEQSKQALVEAAKNGDLDAFRRLAVLRFTRRQ
jgi:hypothetical protein